MSNGKYNRRNYLLRVRDVQNIYTEYHGRGYTDVYIYNTHIYPTFKISRTTFYSYLATPAERDLKELEEKFRREKAAQAKQLSMFEKEI